MESKCYHVVCFHILIRKAKKKRNLLSFKNVVGSGKYCPVSSFCWVLCLSGIRMRHISLIRIDFPLVSYRLPACRTACDVFRKKKSICKKTGSMSFR